MQIETQWVIAVYLLQGKHFKRPEVPSVGLKPLELTKVAGSNVK